VAEAFTAGHIGIEHALLIAKLAADVQEKAFTHCFDGFYAANDSDRSLVLASRLQAWDRAQRLSQSQVCSVFKGR
jgi:hypothetical protein